MIKLSVKVPIRKTKLGKRSPQSKKFQNTTSDLEFLKEISDFGEVIIRSGNRSTTGTAVSFVVPDGKTFYFISGFFQISTQTSGSIRLQNDGVTREDYVGIAGTVEAFRGAWQLPTDSLIGDGVKAYTIDVTAGAGTNRIGGSIVGYIINSETLSSRGGM